MTIKENAQSWTKLVRALDLFRELNPDMSVQTIMVLLTVVMHEGCTIKEIKDRVGFSYASASRNVAALSKWHRLKRPGYDLVEATADPYELRRKLVKLTPKGKEMARRLALSLEPSMSGI